MPRASAQLPRPVVVFACGNADRGDDALASLAASAASGAPAWPDGARLRIVATLTVEDLLAVPERAAVLVVDAVAGIGPGRLVEADLADLEGLSVQASPASSHALPVDRTLALAAVLRGTPLEGRFLGVGVADVTPGAGLSVAVLASLPRVAGAIVSTVRRLAEPAVDSVSAPLPD